MSNCPRSWESVDSPPELRMPTDEEKLVLRGATFPVEMLTEQFAANMVVLYAKAVGFETEAQVNRCLSTVGVQSLVTYESSGHDGPLDDRFFDGSPSHIAWRIGSPDWPHTKLEFHTQDDNVYRASIYANTPWDYNRGLSERDIRIGMYFAEMARGFVSLYAQSEKD